MNPVIKTRIVNRRIGGIAVYSYEYYYEYMPALIQDELIKLDGSTKRYNENKMEDDIYADIPELIKIDKCKKRYNENENITKK